MENIQKTKIAQNVLKHTPGVHFSPKRKFQFKHQNFEGSPSKKQRNFLENLSYWKEIEGGGNSIAKNAHTTPGPKADINICADKMDNTVQSEIITRKDSPGF